MLPSSSDGEEDFDVLGPTSWPVESCFLMGVRVPSSTHDTLGTSAYEVYCHQYFLFGDNADRFGIRNMYSMAPL